MRELNNIEVDQVSGATFDDVRTVAIGTVIGAGMGAWGGPVGVLAGAGVGFAHALLITRLD